MNAKKIKHVKSRFTEMNLCIEKIKLFICLDKVAVKEYKPGLANLFYRAGQKMIVF